MSGGLAERMPDNDEPLFDPETIVSVPVPDHLASGEDETPPPPPPAEPRRKRLLGAPKPGTRDNGFRRDRKIATEPKPLPPIPRNGFAPGIEKMYATLAMGVMPIDMDFGVAIMNVAPEAAKAWDELARRNDTVRRLLVAMMETSAWGAVFAAHMPLFMLVMARAMKGDPRVSMLGEMLANEAERHANEQKPGTE